MRLQFAVLLLLIAAIIFFLTGVAHLSCIYFGPLCYEAQLAPTFIVESAIAGTWIAPVGTVLVALLFFVCTVFGLSRAGLIRPIPLVKTATILIAVICIVRGLLTVQLKIRYPEMVETSHLVAGLVWFLVGLMYGVGHRWTKISELG